MKKFLLDHFHSVAVLVGVIILLVGFTVMGCQSLKNGVTGAQQLLCNPTDTQKADAALAVQGVDTVLAILMAVPQTSGVAGMITALGGAKTIFATVEKGGCVLAGQLSQALDALDQATAQQKSLTKAAPMKKAAPLTSLRQWAGK